jgi:hypothetical protein
LDDLISEAAWLVSVSCVRPEELAFKWIDLDTKNRMLWVVRVVNRGKPHAEVPSLQSSHPTDDSGR